MNKKKVLKVIVIVIIVFVLVNAVGTGVWFMNYQGYFNKGNGKDYALDGVETIEDSPLKRMNIAFLGSSVTKGERSKGISFVEYLAKRNGFTYVKEAVSGTTLVDNGENSYVQRMINNLDKDADFDMVVVQLSTNDAGKDGKTGKPLGAVSDSRSLADFDTATVIGAMEYIICYCEQTWDCPVVFYTGTEFNSEDYRKMVEALYVLQDKWGIGIADLWNGLDTSDADYNLYMADDIHPTQAGYLKWWLPIIEAALYEAAGE